MGWKWSIKYPKSKQEALSKGAEWYMTGRPCKHGHVSKRAARTARCHECKLELSREHSKDANHKMRNGAYFLWRCAKRRARQRGIEFSLDREDIVIPASCPVLGIPLSYSKQRTFNTPSLDRLNAAHGYVKGNVAVISWRANWIKGRATLEECVKLGIFAKQVLEQRRNS